MGRICWKSRFWAWSDRVKEWWMMRAGMMTETGWQVDEEVIFECHWLLLHESAQLCHVVLYYVDVNHPPSRPLLTDVITNCVCCRRCTSWAITSLTWTLVRCNHRKTWHVKHDNWPIQPDILNPPLPRLTSKKPLWSDLQPVDIESRWRHKWKSAQVVNSHLVCDPTIWQQSFNLPRQQWSLLNRFCMEQGHCGTCRRKWRLTDTDLCPCGKTQTMFHSVKSCPLTKLNGGLSRLHSADEDAVSWHIVSAYEKLSQVSKNSKNILQHWRSSIFYRMLTISSNHLRNNLKAYTLISWHKLSDYK